MRPPMAATILTLTAGAAWVLAMGSHAKLGAARERGAAPTSIVPLVPATAAPDTIRVAIGDTLDMTTSLPPDSAAVLRYVTKDSSIVAVSSGGAIRALRAGTASIDVRRASPNAAVVSSTIVIVTTRRALVNMMLNEICPNEDDKRIADTQPIRSDVLLVHEYHDCQRLIDGDTYGPPVGILAHHNVQNAKSWQSFKDGMLAAVIVDLVRKGTTAPYPWLGIEPGTNCLIVRATSAEKWDAAIIPQPDSRAFSRTRHYASCDDHLTWKDVPKDRQGKLTVKLQRGYDMLNQQISPPTARWDWDSEHRRNYIGVKCDDISWCEIGPSGFLPSAARLNPAGKPLIKGYYDEQLLAEPRPSTRPSSVLGTLMPGTHARDITQMKHWIPRWWGAAVISISELGRRRGAAGSAQSGAFDFYVRKFKLKVGAVGAPPQGELELRPVNVLAPHSGYYPRIGGQTDGSWYIHYHRHDNTSLKVPTVRWRWMEKDESTWSYCDPAGCCELMGTAEK